MSTIRLIMLGIALLLISVLHGCGGGGDSDPTPSGDPPSAMVTINRMSGTYYRVDIDMSSGNHYEIGRQYALQIKNAVPNFESLVDSALSATFFGLQGQPASIAFDELNRRAQAIYANIPAEYQQEIQGMQSVFSGTDDTIGNGQLSRNKLLVYELAPDVARLDSCSTSAAFGTGTATGKTIVGRNLEWYDSTIPYLTPLQTAVVMRNGARSIAFFGFLGQLFPLTGVSANKVFVATIDSDVLVPYRLLGGEGSYVMDLRYALENEATLQGVANYLRSRRYAYSFDIFLADENTAAVLEVDPVTPFSGLRTATSPLKSGTAIPITPWPFPNAVACVNWFTLPGTIDNTFVWLGNPARWNSFITLYTNAFAAGATVNIDVMKQIMSYPGPNRNGRGEEGAIWRYNNMDSNVHSVVINMETLETWVSFTPAGQVLTEPNYIQIFSGNPF